MKVTPGDALELRLPEGFAYGTVVLTPAAYPPAIAFLPDLWPVPLDDPLDALRADRTVTALVPLPGDGTVRRIARGQPTVQTCFAIPVRDRKGRSLYHWEWDGQRIEVGSDASQHLPERRIVPISRLATLLKPAR